jgi:hypothetical protein
VLQHENSSDTPDSLDLLRNKNYTREDAKGAIIFRDLKEGIVYTFINVSSKRRVTRSRKIKSAMRGVEPCGAG